MVTFRFDEDKSFEENCGVFLEAIEASNPDMATILRDNWDALLATVKDGARNSEARSVFNSAVASALDSLLDPVEPTDGI